MSGRRLGGGRILGSGKGLTPPAPPTAPRSGSPLALSESTVSLESPSLSPPATGSLPDLGLDIGSSISVGAQAKNSALGATDLICPICTEEMVTLLQLNRHIDDSHQELPEEEQNEVKTWFDKQVLRAKRFQPLTLIHQKLRGLEAFEANESNFAPPQVKGSGRPSLEGPVDPDELITRSHWQRTTSYDMCTDPACGKKLGTLNGSINCRKCGRLFCEEHTMYQIKFSRSANHEPVRGIWARVCETCYKSREGYNDHTGVSIDHTPSFFEIRRKKIERQRLETARLEKRLTKLTRLLAGLSDNPSASNSSLLGSVSSLIGQKDSRKLLEQSVVPWEEDDVVSKCPFCQQEFGSWIFRRHHCRMCGRVVCADIQTACSSEVSLNVSSGEAAQPHHNPLDLRLLTSENVTAATTYSEKAQTSGTSDQLCVDVRICRECDHIIFSHRDFAASLAHKPPDQKAYETLHQFERGIRLLLPSFHRVLLALQPEKSSNGDIDLNNPPLTHAQIQEASKIRRRLIDSFGKYGAAARRMRDLKTDNATQKKLQEAMYTYASGFLHSNLLPLKSVPQMLRTKRVVPSGPSPRCLSMNSSSGLRFTELADSSDVGSQVPSDETSIVISQLETEEKELKERLAVLQEQRLMIKDMISMAKGARRFEEVSALACNGDELDAEIRTLTAKVGDIEIRWEGLYRSGTPT